MPPIRRRLRLASAVCFNLSRGGSAALAMDPCWQLQADLARPKQVARLTPERLTQLGQRPQRDVLARTL